MKYRIETSIEIDMPIQKVWSHFRDFKQQDKWNTFLFIHHEELKIDTPIKVDFLQDGKVKMSMKPTLLKDESPLAFEWIGHMLIRGIFDGHHQFHFIDMGNNRTRLIQSENFSGILIRALLKKVILPTENNFQIMNKSFKAYVESM